MAKIERVHESWSRPITAEYLSRRLLKANTEEVLVIRDALKPFGKGLLLKTSVDPAGWGRAVSNFGLYELGIDRAIKHAGIAYAPQGMSIGDIIRGLLLVHQVLDVEDMQDHVEYL